MWILFQLIVVTACVALGAYHAETVAPGDESVKRGAMAVYGFVGWGAAWLATKLISRLIDRRGQPESQLAPENRPHVSRRSRRPHEQDFEAL